MSESIIPRRQAGRAHATVGIMAVWPFRRRNHRKRPRSENMSDVDSTTRETPEDVARARRRKTEPGSQTQPVPIKRQPNKLQRRERSYSFEKGREDALAIERRKTSRKRVSGAVPQGQVDPRAHPYSKAFGSSSSRTPPRDNDNFLRMPTLHNKRNAEQLSRKKSSKRRKADHAREDEIRAMSGALDPVRPAAEPWQSGRPMKRDTKKARPGLGLSFRRSWDRDQPTSDVSLPLPGSIHSSLSSESEQVSFKVSALEALAPRPTLRYTVNPRYSSPPRERPNRHVSVRNKLSEKRPIPEATLRAHKRVDDLADDLTASDLRELMERDERRRARKREREQERIERRLARRAERDRAAATDGQPSQPNMERGVIGRESVGLGIEPESTVITSSKPRTSPRTSPSPSSKQQGKRPAAEMDDEEDTSDQPAYEPIEHFHRTDSIPLDNVSVASEEAEEPTNHRSSSPRKKIILMPRTSRSRSPPPPLNPAKLESSETDRKTSEGSIKRLRRSWSNLFRWGSRSRRKSGPSSFSNTSRDSMSVPHAPQAPAAAISDALTRKLSSNMPKRTLSRFREDLPELPLSPPQSRDSSPGPAHSAIMEQDSPDLDVSTDEDEPTPKRRDTPMSPEEVFGSVPASMPTSLDPSPEPAPISLGSVDSEGSWFGKRAAPKRGIPMNAPLTPPRTQHRRTASMSSDDSHHDPDLPTQVVADDDEYDHPVHIAEDDNMSDVDEDEYLSRFANQRSSGSHEIDDRQSSEASDDARWGVVGGHRPNVVEARAGDFAKSREGLMNTFSEGADDSEFDLAADDDSKENGLFRANSATRHERGSAKLTNINPRKSTDSRAVPTN